MAIAMPVIAELPGAPEDQEGLAIDGCNVRDSQTFRFTAAGFRNGSPSE
jgi:hypothetical protein